MIFARVASEASLSASVYSRAEANIVQHCHNAASEYPADR